MLELHAYTIEYIHDLIYRLGWTDEAACHYLADELAHTIYRRAGLSESIEEVVAEARRTHRRSGWQQFLSFFAV